MRKKEIIEAIKDLVVILLLSVGLFAVLGGFNGC